MTLLLAAMLPWCAWAATVGKKPRGSDSKGYTITEPENFVWLADQVNEKEKVFSEITFTLDNDIDMSSVSLTPIGTGTYKFLGTFDGNGNTISNLTINGTSNIGLFGYVGAGGIVKDLTIASSCSFTGSGAGVGSIAGKNEGTISNCVNYGTVSSTSNSCGGIVGSSSGTVTGCKNESNVSANKFAGGIVGNLTGGGNISYCINTGNVYAEEGYAGGILGNGIGENKSGIIKTSKATHCFSCGNVSAPNCSNNDFFRTGAVIGCNGSFMSTTDCYYAPNVTVTVNGTAYTYQSTGGCGAGRNEAPSDTGEGAVTYCSTTLTPTPVSGTYWTTYYNGVCSMKVEGNTTTKVYAATRNGETLTLKEVTDGIINKGQGVILKSTASSIAMTSTSDMSECNAAYTGNVLSGVDEETTQTSGNTYYVLSKGSADETANEVGFYKYSSGNTHTLAAHKAFMAVQGEQGIRSFVFEDDAAGIRQVEAKDQQGTPRVYDLQGRSVPTMKKGIYVVNSKKIWNR